MVSFVISHFLSLILLIWVFFFCLVQLRFCQFCLPFQRTNFCFIEPLHYSFSLHLINFRYGLYYFLSSINFWIQLAHVFLRPWSTSLHYLFFPDILKSTYRHSCWNCLCYIPQVLISVFNDLHVQCNSHQNSNDIHHRD
jgi:hypothetical protein